MIFGPIRKVDLLIMEATEPISMKIRGIISYRGHESHQDIYMLQADIQVTNLSNT